MDEDQGIIAEQVEDEVGEVEEQEGQDETGEDQAEEAEESAADDGGEVAVTIGDDPGDDDEPPEEAPSWVKRVREQNRDLKKRLKELEKAQPVKAAPPLRPKPTLEAADYDSERFEKDLASWYEEKNAHDASEAKKREAEQKQQRAWQDKVSRYETLKGELKASDKEDAEEAVKDAFDATKQGIIIQGAKNPALVVYALGKNPARLAELAEITDPVVFAFEVARLETEIKMRPRKAPPKPERSIKSGTGTMSGALDKTLERLEAEAAKTGDRTAVIRYKRQQAARQ